MIVGPINSGAAVGNNGAATANKDSSIPMDGLIYAVQVVYNDAPPAGTTDISITTKGTNAPIHTILAIANAATDGIFLPRLDTCKATDGSALSMNDALIPVCDYVNVKIDQANAADNIDVYFYLV